MGHLAILLGQYYYHFHYREEMWAEELRLLAQDPMACNGKELFRFIGFQKLWLYILITGFIGCLNLICKTGVI